MNQHDTNQVPILVSIIPNLIGGEGHIIPYHNSLTEAANILGWKHVLAVAPDTAINNLPSNWHFCLSHENLEREMHPITRIFKFIEIYRLGTAIANYLKVQVLPYSNYPIIFIERFIHAQIFALLIALYLIPKRDITVWLLYRRDVHKAKTRWIYKLINQTIKKKLAPGKFHLLTDSETLSKSLASYFNEIVTVMPIPHTDVIHSEICSKPDNKIICWWAGPPREEKGWDVIKHLVSYVSEEASKICIVAAESSGLMAILGGVKVKLIPNNLTRVQYLEQLATCDFVLLPYDKIAYSDRTSGIFTECIMAGKIPLVTEETWMAKELYKYSIEELVTDWKNPEIFVKQITQLSKCLTVKSKIVKIKQEYQGFHNVQSYAQSMKNLLDLP
jgi:hypothetical protein